MAQLSPLARILYMGLWCIADDEGRGRYHPKQIEGEVFPHEDVDIRALLGELEDMGRIVVYKVGAESYFNIPKFTTYQHPNRLVPSRLPIPPDTAGTLREHCVDTAPAMPVVVEEEGEEEVGVEVEVVSAPEAQNGRNYVWDAFAELFGEPSNAKLKRRRGANVNPVIASLAHEQGLQPSTVKASVAAYTEVLHRAQSWPLHFESATLTEEALAKHWDTLGRPALRAGPDVGDEVRRQARRLEAARNDRGIDQ